MKNNKALYFLIISLLIPILSNAANIQQRPVLNKSYGAIKLMPHNYGYSFIAPIPATKAYGYGLKNTEIKNTENKKDYGYGYAPIDKNIEAKGYGYAFAYGHDKYGYGPTIPVIKSYGLKNTENKKDYGYGNIIQQKPKTSIFNNIFNSIKNIFSKRKTK